MRESQPADTRVGSALEAGQKTSVAGRRSASGGPRGPLLQATARAEEDPAGQ